MKPWFATVLLIGLLCGPALGRSADFDGSGKVDFDDFFLYVDHFGETADGSNRVFDLNGDGRVDFDDFFLYVDHFGETVAPPPKELTLSLPGGVVVAMVWIGPGTFTLGSPASELGRYGDEGPQHQVTLSQGFYLGKYEITQRLWTAVMGTKPWAGQRYVQDSPDNPAVDISWEDVQQFVRKLNQVVEEDLFRLPTEAEWEYACRAGTATRWSFGDDESRLGEYARHYDNTCGAEECYAHAVGTRLPNPWGLYDMHGNVWEWVEDWYQRYGSGAQIDPQGPAAGVARVFRGGSFDHSDQDSRSAVRNNFVPDSYRYFLGARLARLAETGSENRMPHVEAGADQKVQVGMTVQLDGRGSFDLDGPEALAYHWTAPAGIELLEAASAQPWFVAKAAGRYVFRLVVNDGLAESESDEVAIVVEGEPSGKTQVVALPGGVTMELVWIQPGTFTMGSPDSEPGRDGNEGPQHQVTISQGFWLGKYEITQGQWLAVMGTKPWGGQPDVQDSPDNPAMNISWNDVQGFIQKLNQAAGTGVYRLPTEAEWEYACRAGTETRWSFGDDESRLKEYAWYYDNTCGARECYPHAAGTRLPNPWGLYDMHGNVWEWCQDWYDSYSSGAQTDPPGPATGTSGLKAKRGGGFGYVPRLLRSAERSYNPPDVRYRMGARLRRTK
jgi:formylglycine-generating enzyme required for sulfatase activity